MDHRVVEEGRRFFAIKNGLSRRACDKHCTKGPTRHPPLSAYKMIDQYDYGNEKGIKTGRSTSYCPNKNWSHFHSSPIRLRHQRGGGSTGSSLVINQFGQKAGMSLWKVNIYHWQNQTGSMFTNLRLVVDEITRRGYVYYCLSLGPKQTTCMKTRGLWYGVCKGSNHTTMSNIINLVQPLSRTVEPYFI